jgi:hypothetical protein
MKALALVTLLLIAPSAALAGEVYGKITEGGAAAAGASVEAKCGDKSFPAAAADKSGSYHLVLDKTGKCTLTVKHKDQSASLDIASYDEAVQVDIALEVKEGKLTARRK